MRALAGYGVRGSAFIQRRCQCGDAIEGSLAHPFVRIAQQRPDVWQRTRAASQGQEMTGIGPDARITVQREPANGFDELRHDHGSLGI